MGKPKALVITVGKGRNVEHGMVKSIENQNPDLVLFLATQESWDAKKPLLFELLPNLQLINDFKEFKSGADSIFAVVKIVNETFDLEKLILAYSDAIRELLKYFPPQNVTADYTPGTKAMSAALAIVAIEMGLKSLSYIAGDRDIDGRVISGSEREITLTPSKYLCLRNILESVKLFNRKCMRYF